jgi:hypothetical protein
VSVFSPLDKTIAVLQPKGEKGFILFILNCQSFQASMQWFALIRHPPDGSPREKTVVVTVPDLDHLQIQVNAYREDTTAINDQGQPLLNGAAISVNDVVERCMTELRKCTRYQDILDYWGEKYEMGLCWKRYDRIEWLTGTTDETRDELTGTGSLQHVSPQDYS